MTYQGAALDRGGYDICDCLVCKLWDAARHEIDETATTLCLQWACYQDLILSDQDPRPQDEDAMSQEANTTISVVLWKITTVWHRSNSQRSIYNTIQYKICKAPCCRGFRGAGEQDRETYRHADCNTSHPSGSSLWIATACDYRLLEQNKMKCSAGLLLWAWCAGDIDQLLHGRRSAATVWYFKTPPGAK